MSGDDYPMDKRIPDQQRFDDERTRRAVEWAERERAHKAGRPYLVPDSRTKYDEYDPIDGRSEMDDERSGATFWIVLLICVVTAVAAICLSTWGIK